MKTWFALLLGIMVLAMVIAVAVTAPRPASPPPAPEFPLDSLLAREGFRSRPSGDPLEVYGKWATSDRQLLIRIVDIATDGELHTDLRMSAGAVLVHLRDADAVAYAAERLGRWVSDPATDHDEVWVALTGIFPLTILQSQLTPPAMLEALKVCRPEDWAAVVSFWASDGRYQERAPSAVFSKEEIELRRANTQRLVSYMSSMSPRANGTSAVNAEVGPTRQGDADG
jgi:hypothetical protein